MTVEQRLRNVELRCRFVSILLLLCVSSAGVVLLCGAQTPNEPPDLRVGKLEVVDEHGNVRIRLGRIDSDTFGVTLFDGKGERRVIIIDASQVNLINEKGQASLCAWTSGASLQLAGPGLRPRAMIYAEDDHAAIQLRDTNDKVASITETPRRKGATDRVADPFAP